MKSEIGRKSIMAKYKIGVCCTFGAGSSLMLKMNLDSVF